MLLNTSLATLPGKSGDMPYSPSTQNCDEFPVPSLFYLLNSLSYLIPYHIQFKYFLGLLGGASFHIVSLKARPWADHVVNCRQWLFPIRKTKFIVVLSETLFKFQFPLPYLWFLIQISPLSQGFCALLRNAPAWHNPSLPNLCFLGFSRAGCQSNHCPWTGIKLLIHNYSI